jgi:hypothetical protein
VTDCAEIEGAAAHNASGAIAKAKHRLTARALDILSMEGRELSLSSAFLQAMTPAFSYVSAL